MKLNRTITTSFDTFVFGVKYDLSKYSGRVLRFIYLFHTLHHWEERDNQSLHKPGNAVRYWNCYCTFTVEAARPIRCRFEADSAPGRERAPVVSVDFNRPDAAAVTLISFNRTASPASTFTELSSESWVDYYTRRKKHK